MMFFPHFVGDARPREPTIWQNRRPPKLMALEMFIASAAFVVWAPICCPGGLLILILRLCGWAGFVPWHARNMV
jgi:hypothetical protein